MSQRSAFWRLLITVIKNEASDKEKHWLQDNYETHQLCSN